MRMLFAALALAAFAAPSVARDRGHVPEATPTGTPQRCIPISNMRESHVRDDRTIDFVTSGGTVYRNTLPFACPSLGFEERFSYATSLSQLCSTDTITVLETGGGTGLSRGATCGLGVFQPVTLTQTTGPRRRN
ncbi:hypothetical protein [Sphingomonas sp. PAMC 26605]|uniref:hypothetical protein n=1 Tax=Sphingomonas sp. PAMC 26605 TaxID=1112214 RepID=UPI00026CDC10|nr:hypothetical protein [Sphingomonas sp. PAMC 26605]